LRSAFISFTIIYTALVLLLYAYLSKRLFSYGWPTGSSGRLGLAIPFLFAYLMPFFLLLRTTRPHHVTPDLVFWLTFLSMSFLGVLLTLVVLRDLGWLMVKLGAFLAPSWLATFPAALESSWATKTLLLLALVLTPLGFLESHRTPRVKTLEVPLAGLAPAMDGYRVVLLSALHVGPTIKRPFVTRVVERVNSLNPDLVAFPGDVCDGNPRNLDVHLQPLRDIKSRDGLYYTTGNHEYYWGAADWVDKMRSLGWTPLLNEHRVVRRDGSGLVIAGLTDLAALRMDREHSPDERKALEGSPQGMPVLWLSHQPNMVNDVARLGPSLMLSGHTHGGQCFPWNLLLGFFQPYERGLYHVGDTTLYVSTGTGYWGPPNRLGVPSEITLIVLRSKEAP